MNPPVSLVDPQLRCKSSCKSSSFNYLKLVLSASASAVGSLLILEAGIVHASSTPATIEQYSNQNNRTETIASSTDNTSIAVEISGEARNASENEIISELEQPILDHENYDFVTPSTHELSNQVFVRSDDVEVDSLTHSNPSFNTPISSLADYQIDDVELNNDWTNHENGGENESVYFTQSSVVADLNSSDWGNDFTSEQVEAEPENVEINGEPVDWVTWFDHVRSHSLASAQIVDEGLSHEPGSDQRLLNDEFASYETNADALLSDAPLSNTGIAQSSPQSGSSEETAQNAERIESDRLNNPIVQLQGVYLLEGDESSARARLSGSYAISPNVLFGTTIDLTTGDAFTDSPEAGVDLNELFLTVSPSELPNFRVTLGMIDLTSYFDRNSFAKDAATHFFNPVFQTNPALAAAGIGSRPGVLVNWDVTDNLSVRGAAFSSDRDLDDFAFDAAAAEIGLRLGNAIIRGTYVTNRDAGQDSGFQEIFQFPRGDDEFGILSGDREVAYGVNAEYFIPEINLGLFARYGWYNNQTLDENGNTYSFGINALDLFFADDRLGIGYGRDLSNDALRRDRDDDIPDVFEAFYDVRVTPNIRAAVMVQGREGWSETVLGLRVRADFNLAGLGR